MEQINTPEANNCSEDEHLEPVAEDPAEDVEYFLLQDIVDKDNDVLLLHLPDRKDTNLGPRALSGLCALTELACFSVIQTAENQTKQYPRSTY